MRILGVDPGLATVGLGYVDSTSAHDIRAGEWLTIQTKAGLPIADRLQEIRTDLLAYIREIKPDIAVLEKLFFSTNRKTAIDVAQARGVILLALAESQLPIVEPTPLQLKSCITGDGGADKQQVQEMLMRTLNLAKIPTPDDAADALGLAVYGAIVCRGEHVMVSPTKHDMRASPSSRSG